MPTVEEYATQFHYHNSTTAQHIMNNPPPVQQQQQPMVDLAEQLMAIEEKLAEDLMKLTYEFPVEYVYNPIKHAKELHYNFLKRYYRSGPKPILFLGMNPGPWGMVQTGVPFGEVGVVKEWLKITGDVVKPENEHPKRLIEGLQCKRKEVSGRRFWEFFKGLCGTPENFTQHCLVYNYCPLSFMTKSGKNVTPPELKFEVRYQLFSLCDDALCQVLELFGVKKIVGLGRYVESRAIKLVRQNGWNTDISTHFLLHPSPASPTANNGWNGIATKMLQESRIWPILAQNNPQQQQQPVPS